MPLRINLKGVPEHRPGTPRPAGAPAQRSQANPVHVNREPLRGPALRITLLPYQATHWERAVAWLQRLRGVTRAAARPTPFDVWQYIAVQRQPVAQRSDLFVVELRRCALALPLNIWEWSTAVYLYHQPTGIALDISDGCDLPAPYAGAEFGASMPTRFAADLAAVLAGQLPSFPLVPGDEPFAPDFVATFPTPILRLQEVSPEIAATLFPAVALATRAARMSHRSALTVATLARDLLDPEERGRRRA